MGHFNKCCCCAVGAVITRYQNITGVRPAGDTLGPHYTATPYQRLDPSGDPTPDCSVAGSCGGWLVGGDLNGKSAQEVNDMVDDIGGCSATLTDHNCYQTNGTVDNRQPKRFGAQWLLARKYWHGAFGWKSNDRCAQDPNVAADQTKYLQFHVEASWNCSFAGFGPSGGGSASNIGSYSGTNSVNRYTGIVTNSLAVSQDYVSGGTTVLHNNNGVGYDNSGTPTNYLSNMMPMGRDARSWQPPLHGIGDFACANQPSLLAGIFTAGYFTIDGLDNGGNHFTVNCPVSGTADSWSCSGSAACYYNPSNDGVTWVYLGTSTISISFTRTNTSVSYSVSANICDYVYSSIDSISVSVSASLASAYTASDCYSDFNTLLNSWDLSDQTLASLRTDEALALGPLAVYDEVGPVSPDLVWLITMDDYAGSLVTDANGISPGGTGYTTTWSQRAWLDPNNYLWKYPNGSYSQPTPFTGGATLLTPMRTGTVISHNPAGYDRHFWFKYHQLERVSIGGTSTWIGYKFGGYSDGNLPPVTLRWMDNLEAQNDPYTGGGTNIGNFPQAWVDQIGGVIRGGKYVVATQTWPGVNFGRPCGADKYAVDQTTVCCVQGGNSATGYLVQPTNNAIAPLAAGGLAVNDYIAVGGDGVFKISGITVSGSQWLINVTGGSRVDYLPTGFAMSWTGDSGGGYLGRLRWPTAPGICGRAPVTVSWSSPTLTITSTAALPYLRINPTMGTILVDLYDASMTLLASSVSLSRVSDTQWTCTANQPTTAYLVAAGVDWTKNSSASRKTGVNLAWTFNKRQAQPGYTSPPTWYGGLSGVLSCSINQFAYSGSCPALLGIVPDSGSPEALNQKFSMPGSFAFDDIFGAHWQGAIMLTMVDPFWQRPYVPDCTASVTWMEDDGSGHVDDPPTSYFPHHPLVEAMANVPFGDTLPSGVTFTYDSSNIIAPPYFPYGIQCGGDSLGSYQSIETDWGFAGLACANIAGSGRFVGIYATFVSC